MGKCIAGDFTLDDAAAVCLYTFDFGDDRHEMNPYGLLNRALRAEKNMVKEIVKVRDVLFLVTAITSEGMDGRTQLHNLTTQKASSLPLFFWRGGYWRLFVPLVWMVGRESKNKGIK